MSERELRALRKDAAEQAKLSSQKAMENEAEAMEADLLRKQVKDLQEQLDAAKVTFEDKLEQAEKRREDEVTMIRMEVELKSLRELENLRQQFDKEREQWRKEKERDAEQVAEWKTVIQGERENLLKRVKELEEQAEHHCSSSGETESGLGSGTDSPGEDHQAVTEGHEHVAESTEADLTGHGEGYR